MIKIFAFIVAIAFAVAIGKWLDYHLFWVLAAIGGLFGGMIIYGLIVSLLTDGSNNRPR